MRISLGQQLKDGGERGKKPATGSRGDVSRSREYYLVLLTALAVAVCFACFACFGCFACFAYSASSVVPLRHGSDVRRSTEVSMSERAEGTLPGVVVVHSVARGSEKARCVASVGDWDPHVDDPCFRELRSVNARCVWSGPCVSPKARP